MNTLINSVTALVVQDGHTSLSEEQLAAIEAALAATPATDNTALDAANATIAERDETINTLNNRIAELEKKPGASSAQVVKPTDGSTQEDSAGESVFERLNRMMDEKK